VQVYWSATKGFGDHHSPLKNLGIPKLAREQLKKPGPLHERLLIEHLSCLHSFLQAALRVQE